MKKKRFRAFLDQNLPKVRRTIFSLSHTGLQPALPQLIKFIPRPRKVLHRANFALRKKALYTQFHLFVTNQRWQTRPRKVLRHNSFQLRKRALWHQLLSPSILVNPNTNHMITRKRTIWKRKARTNHMFVLYHTGLTPAQSNKRPWLNPAIMSGGYRRGGQY